MPQTVNKISRILCKNCFRIFYFGILLPFRIFYFGIFHPFRIFYFGIFHPFRIFYFAPLLLFRTFCNTHPHFLHTKTPPPKPRERGNRLYLSLHLRILVKTCDFKCITSDKKLLVCRNYPYLNLAVGSRDLCELAL